MSHDGCLEVAWKGNAFPYLLNHNTKVDSYGAHRAASSAAEQGHSQQDTSASDTMTRAGTGTWNGAAPRGYADGQQAAPAVSPTAPVPADEPDTVRLSNNVRMPMVGLGTYAITDPQVVKTALDLGYRHLDCAYLYGNEAVVGEGIKDFIAQGRRAELFVVSKVWNTHHRPEDARASCLASLQALGCQYLDLLLLHWPNAWLPGSTMEEPKADKGVTLLETWRALEALVSEGLVRSLGVSNFSLKQVEGLMAQAAVHPVVNQVELHPQLAQRKLVGVSFRKGVQSVAYAPLGSQGYCRQNMLLSHPSVLRVAQECGKSPAQVLLKWNLQRGVPVIPKASSPAHLQDNLQGIFSWKLSNHHKALLDELDAGQRYVTFPWAQWGDVEEGGVTKPSKVL